MLGNSQKNQPFCFGDFRLSVQKEKLDVWGSQTEAECSDTVGKHADTVSPPHSCFVLFLGSEVL